MSHHRDSCCASRRAMLAGTGAGVAALLAGCQTYGQSAAPPAPAPPAPSGAAPTESLPSTDGPSEEPTDEPPAAPALAAVSDIPVGGGRIFEAEGVVVTQPRAGTIKAFSAACTHQGCTVSSVADGLIICACHNSRFDITDGSVKGGPAGSPLPEAGVSVDGDDIRLA